MFMMDLNCAQALQLITSTTRAHKATGQRTLACAKTAVHTRKYVMKHTGLIFALNVNNALPPTYTQTHTYVSSHPMCTVLYPDS